VDVESLKGFVRESWYLFVVVAVAFVAAIYGFMTDEPEPEVEPVANVNELPQGLSRAEAEKAYKPPPPKGARLTPEDEARVYAPRHLERVEKDPEAEDAPAYLCAAANLKKRLREYEEAAQLYERLLEEYPTWNNAYGVYPKLAHCYTMMEDEGRAENVWRRMMNSYPKGTQNYELAKSHLNLL